MKHIKVFARKLSLALMATVLAFIMIPSDFAFADARTVYECYEGNWDNENCFVISSSEQQCKTNTEIKDPYRRNIVPNISTFSDIITIGKNTENSTDDSFDFRIRSYQEEEIYKSFYTYNNAGMLWTLIDEIEWGTSCSYMLLPDDITIDNYPTATVRYESWDNNSMLNGYTYGYSQELTKSIISTILEDIKLSNHIQYKYPYFTLYSVPEGITTSLVADYNGKKIPITFKGSIQEYDVGWVDFWNDGYLFIDTSYKNYLDLSSQLGSPVSDNTYEFKLKPGESRQIEIPEYYHYEITEVPKDGWELVDINGNTSLSKAEGIIGETSQTEYIFKNRLKTNSAEEPTKTEDLEKEPEISVPNTGENQASTSAVRTGIIAFSIIMIFGRIVYLVRKYKSQS